MDLELQRVLLEGYQLTADAVLSQEETLESIVPDAFPDISRIVRTSGAAYLTAKQVNNGSLKMMGTASISILYMPEDDSVMRSLNVKLPFQCNGDNPKIKDADQLHATVLSVIADARLINPRKLFIKTEIKFSTKVYSQYSREIVSDLAAKDDSSIQKQWQNAKHYAISAVLEKPFLFTDTLHQSSSKPQIEELLTYSISPTTIEARYIGKKLVCKGELSLSALYRTGTDLNTSRFELPFSQILDMESSFDEGDPDVGICLKNAECNLRDGDLEVSVEAALQASLWSHKDITLLSDIYSTAAPLDVERSTGLLCSSCEQEVRKEPARKFCESGIPAKQVLDCTVSPNPVTMQRTENSMEATTEVDVHILYLSEDNAVCSVDYNIPVTCSMTTPSGTESRCTYRPVGDVSAVPVTGGFEVRLELEFCWRIIISESIPYVSAIKQISVQAGGNMTPSVIIRMVNTGESLWDIGKSCGATITDICTANELQTESITPGTILLIPIRR